MLSDSGEFRSRGPDHVGEWGLEVERDDLGANGSWDPLEAVMADAAEAAAAEQAVTGPAEGLEEPAPADAEPGIPEEAESGSTEPNQPPERASNWGFDNWIAESSDAPFTFTGDMEQLRFIRLTDKATLPTRGHDNDAGLDLYAAEGARIGPGQRVSVGTGLAVQIPDALAGLVLPRSGLALKHGVTLVNSPGLIDPGYRGEVRVVLLNTDQNAEFRLSAGDRVAQLIMVPVAHARPNESDELDSSSRGAGGFGSTGS
jgi:dUTP pyrophosphatase